MRTVWVSLLVTSFLAGPGMSQQPKRDDTHVDSVVRQAVADEFSSEITTNRTLAYLSCESGEMLIKMNFSEPFRGVTYADYDRSSPCRFYGDGSRYYEMHIPLKGCGTKQEAPRVFINNMIVRFHRSLELEEDEIKTIICRYPPPFAPPPGNVVAPILQPIPPVPAIVPPKLSEIELLLIICALLFLTLLLLGIGIAYYCLKKRNIKVVKKKKAISSAPGSEITKLSGSTLGTLSMFEPIRIPRAIAPSTSGSEAALMTQGSGETIPSDYPSSSSDVEELEGPRSLVVSEASTMRRDRRRFENMAFIPDEGSVHSDYPEDKERADSVSSIPVVTVTRPTLAVQQSLTTIHEREDVLTADTLQKRQARVSTVQHAMLPPLPKTKPPSLYGSIPDNDDWSHSELVEGPPVRPYVREPKRRMATLTDYLLDTQRTTDIQEDITRRDLSQGRELVPIPPPKQPKITVQNIDDVYVTTTHEIDTQEHLTKHTRDTSEHLRKAHSPDWDVTIRHYPGTVEETTTAMDERDIYSSRRAWDSYSEVSEKFRDAESTVTEPARHPLPPRLEPLDVMIRVLHPPPTIERVDELTIEDKERWRTILTQDTVFRSLITEATTTEEYVRISRDERYEHLYEPRKWQVIIRILTAPEYLHPPAETEPAPDVRPPRYRKKSETELLRTRRGSLPPLYESGTPPLQDPTTTPGSVRSRRTSRSGSIWDYDLRSMTEEDVDFTRADRESLWSVDTGYTYRTSRSIAERSTSEFVEDVPTVPRRRNSAAHPVLERSVSQYLPLQEQDPTTDSDDQDSNNISRKAMVARYAHVAQSFSAGGEISSSSVRTAQSRTMMQSSSNGEMVINNVRRGTSSVGEREDVKSVTETDIYDWQR